MALTLLSEERLACITLISWPVLKSHTLIDPSSPPEITITLFGWKLTAVTGFECPESGLLTEFSKSYNLVDYSSLPEAKMFWFELRLSELIVEL